MRKGAWYSFDGDNVGQGRDNTIGWMEQHPEACEVIEQRTRERLTAGADVTANSMKPLAAVGAKRKEGAERPAPAAATPLAEAS